MTCFDHLNNEMSLSLSFIIFIYYADIVDSASDCCILFIKLFFLYLFYERTPTSLLNNSSIPLN